MDHSASWVPDTQSPDLSYTPVSPDLSGTAFRPESPDLSGSLGSPRFGNFNSAAQHNRFPSAFGGNSFNGGNHHQPTSIPQQQFDDMPPRQMKTEDDDDYMPDAPPAKRGRKAKQAPPAMNGMAPAFPVGTSEHTKTELSDPTLGCKLNTSFPVARIKRIMQADEDIGKVAQVTPTVVSRALELFMIKLISAAAHQARGTTQAGGAGKGPRRVLAQHLKKAVLAEEKFDFLNEIVDKVPDAPTKSKKETGGSDSEEAKPKRKGKKRKDSGDDF